MRDNDNCQSCGGDGRETCSNPDHGFIGAVGGEIGRLGCPVCGHDPYCKVPDGGDCEECNGTGIDPEAAIRTLKYHQFNDDNIAQMKCMTVDNAMAIIDRSRLTDANIGRLVEIIRRAMPQAELDRQREELNQRTAQVLREVTSCG